MLAPCVVSCARNSGVHKSQNCSGGRGVGPRMIRLSLRRGWVADDLPPPNSFGPNWKRTNARAAMTNKRPILLLSIIEFDSAFQGGRAVATRTAGFAV